MTKLKILVSGCGIAGPSLVYWLAGAKQEFSITVVERSATPRTTGQAIDIRGQAVEVMRKMGLEEKVRELHTTERGLLVLNATGKIKGEFPQTGSTEVQSFTSEFEIQRSDLSELLMDAVQEHATWIYGEYVTKIEQSDDASGQVHVEFANGKPAETYDLVVGADGLTSNTRRLVFGAGPEGNNYMYHLGQCFNLFTIPQVETADKFSRWTNMSHGRVMMLRPDRKGETSVILAVTRPDLSKFEKAAEKGNEAVKAVLREEFQDGNWTANKVLDGMDQATDFYYTPITQVRMTDFVKGSVALLGDSGFCPSPLGGQGTSAAMLGAYILAGEITQSMDDIPSALKRYQERMKPVVEKFQHLPPGMPGLVNPQSPTGIFILQTVVRVLSTKLFRNALFSTMPGNSKKDAEPPYYPLLAA